MSGRVACVTGANSGLGRAMARVLAEGPDAFADLLAGRVAAAKIVLRP